MWNHGTGGIVSGSVQIGRRRPLSMPIDLEKPSRNYRKVFIRNSNNTHWIGNLMTFEITKGELARNGNGKLSFCWFYVET
jgi:hypothetical protein